MFFPALRLIFFFPHLPPLSGSSPRRGVVDFKLFIAAEASVALHSAAVQFPILAILAILSWTIVDCVYQMLPGA
jgi:hypothetical protein